MDEKGMDTSPKQICKTVQQYNKNAISQADMQKLQEIAQDCRRVKNYVYQRYGGIAGLGKLYPGYTVQNEMTESGLRESLGLPSVYFYLAVFDALSDIKSQWTRVKTRISKQAAQNSGFTDEEKHYIRFVLKVGRVYEAILNQEPVSLPEALQEQYELLGEGTDVRRLHNYLRRLTRKYQEKLHTDSAEGFSVSKKAYRYADHGIYIATKEKRKRIFILLTDGNSYTSQLYIKLCPEKSGIEIKAPVYVAVREHPDYRRQTGLAMGMSVMLTTDEGRRYGERLGEYQTEYADWMRKQVGIYKNNKESNPGRKKYANRKRRYEEQLHSYINQELNRLFREEKSRTLYLPRLPGNQGGGKNKRLNNYASLWQRGYIRKRLSQKCKEHSTVLIEVAAKNISRECSMCGAFGRKEEGIFSCPSCGYREDSRVNAARNAKKRGELSYRSRSGQ